MECPICCDTYDSLLGYRCDNCKQTECLQCYQSWNKEECPFCRYKPVEANSKIIEHAHTYPGNSVSSGIWGGRSEVVPFWESSRILTRQIRRDRKRQEHELQQIRNAELSRIHNYQHRKSPPKTKQEKRQDMQFHIDDLYL